MNIFLIYNNTDCMQQVFGKVILDRYFIKKIRFLKKSYKIIGVRRGLMYVKASCGILLLFTLRHGR